MTKEIPNTKLTSTIETPSAKHQISGNLLSREGRSCYREGKSARGLAHSMTLARRTRRTGFMGPRGHRGVATAAKFRAWRWGCGSLGFKAMNLATAFAEIARKDPKKTAIYWGDREYPYAELLEQTARVALELQRDFAVKPGDRVGLWLKNCPEFVPALFGILAAGAVVVPINNFLKPAEVNYILADAGADVLITDQTMVGFVAELQQERPQLKSLLAERFSGTTRYPVEPGEILGPQNEADLAVIVYTSGTTGRPKGAMLSHGNLLHNVESCRL